MTKTQLKVLSVLANVFEERVLDDDCAKNKMKWDDYMTKILSGWVPDTLGQTHQLSCYLKAVTDLRNHGLLTGGLWFLKK